MRTRPRRLLLVAAAIALCAGLFLAIQEPLQAQSGPRITIVIGDKAYTVTRQQIEEGGDITDRDFPMTNETGNETTVHVTRGATLSRLLELAGVPDSLGVIALPRRNGNGTYYAERDDALVFHYEEGQSSEQPGQMMWFRERKNQRDRNGIDAGHERSLELVGHRGNLLEVDLTSDPSENFRAKEPIKFTATVGNLRDGEEVDEYIWDFGDGKTETTETNTVTHEYSKKARYGVTVTVVGNKDSIGEAVTAFRTRSARPEDTGGGSGGGSGGGGGGGGGSGGASPGGGGGGSFTPSPAPAPAPTPSLPPPSSSPPSDSGSGPNLDPSPPDTSSTDTGEEVEGILVSASAPPKPGQTRAGQAAQAQQKQAKKNDEAIDWKLAGGISLTALLVILGAVRERVHIQRLLPHPT